MLVSFAKPAATSKGRLAARHFTDLCDLEMLRTVATHTPRCRTCRLRFVQQLTALLQLRAPALKRALLCVRRLQEVRGRRESSPRHEHRKQHALCSSG